MSNSPQKTELGDKGCRGEGMVLLYQLLSIAMLKHHGQGNQRRKGLSGFLQEAREGWVSDTKLWKVSDKGCSRTRARVVGSYVLEQGSRENNMYVSKTPYPWGMTKVSDQ